MSPAWSGLGDLLAFRRDSTGFLLRIARERGDIAEFRLGRTRAVLLSHPDQVREVLVDRAAEFSKGRLMQRARRLLGDGLLTSEGDLHRTQRRRIQPVFTRERLQHYFSLVPPIAAEHGSRWTHAGRVQVDAGMDRLAMKIVAGALLGVDIEHDVPGLGNALRTLGKWAPLLAAPGGQLLERSRLPLLRNFRLSVERVEAAIDRGISSGGSDAALLGGLMHSGTGTPMSSRLVRDEVMTIFLAGHDTTAAALTWMWILLGRHPEAERRLHQELASVLMERQPTVADLDRLPYAAMVVKETLRLYPPIGRIGRRPLHDIQLGGSLVPRDAAVFLSPFVTQRDSRWFAKPHEFRPERWAEPDPGRPRFAWFPFGAGPRSCVGEHFAVGVMILALATLAQRWRLRPVSRILPRRRSLLTLKPRGGIWMMTHSR